MPVNPVNIHIGAGRIWLGVTAPATGGPPTLLTHVSGVPATGTEVGYTNGVSTFTYQATKKEIQAEQSLNPVDVYVTTEMVQLDFTAMEHVYNTLKAAFDNIGTTSDGSHEAIFYGGDGQSLLTVGTQTVVLTSPRRDNPAKFEVLMLYKAYEVNGIVIAYDRQNPAQYKMTMKGLVDSTRQAGDRLFQWFREK